MNAHSHAFTEPYWPASFEADALAIDAQHQGDSELREWARRIARDGVSAMPKSDYELYAEADWLDVSHALIDGEDTADFAFMLVRANAFDEFCEWTGHDPKREDEDFGNYCDRFRPDAVVKVWRAS